jgi:phosphoribosylglycinamide formyltransferase-1
MPKIAVLISGGGSNLQSVIDNIKSKNLMCSIEYVISDRECSGIKRAENEGIKSVFLDRKIYKGSLSEKINEVLEGNADYIVLAGFLSILDKDFVKKWDRKIINIHPSLLPKYGGAGMYGIKIHEAVIKNGEKESGCTVHYVDGGIDTGEIIIQERVPVLPEDTPETLQQRVLEKEHKILTEAIKKVINQ